MRRYGERGSLPSSSRLRGAFPGTLSLSACGGHCELIQKKGGKKRDEKVVDNGNESRHQDESDRIAIGDKLRLEIYFVVEREYEL